MKEFDNPIDLVVDLTKKALNKLGWSVIENETAGLETRSIGIVLPKIIWKVLDAAQNEVSQTDFISQAVAATVVNDKDFKTKFLQAGMMLMYLEHKEKVEASLSSPNPAPSSPSPESASNAPRQ